MNSFYEWQLRNCVNAPFNDLQNAILFPQHAAYINGGANPYDVTQCCCDPIYQNQCQQKQEDDSIDDLEIVDYQ